MPNTTTTGDSLPADIREHYKLPVPTQEFPFAQVEWVFYRVMYTKAKKSTQLNYINAKNFFLDHLKALGFEGPYLLQKEWDSLALVRLRQQLEKRIDEGQLPLASLTLVGIFSAIRHVMNYASTRGLTGCDRMLEVSYGSGGPETNAQVAYSDAELTQILDAVGGELATSRRILKGY